jgi:hypothetical protein
MGIKRYTANADTTITNAYKANLNTRGTDANMGLADSLEVFHIFGQESSTSAENSRVLINFPVTDIISERSAGEIPASGSVSWFLRVHNVAHPSTLPRNYNMTILAVSSSWDEGTGMDMEEYSDVGATSWLYRNDTPTAATGTITVTSNPSSGTFTVTVAGTTVTVTSGASATDTATAIKTALNNDVTIGALVTATSLAAVVTITADTGGSAGNYAYSATNGNGTITAAGSIMTGGLAYTLWTAEGGDYHAAPSYTSYFDNGTEDIEVDISFLVEEWMSGATGSYGVGIRMENESAFSSSYTKKFSARGSQYFYSRPTLEARWDSATKDDRGNFYYSSSLAPAADNLNDVYLYNYSRGRLVDIPGIGSGDNIYVNFYASTSDAPSGSKLLLPIGGGVVANLDTTATGSWVSTGVYSANLAITSSASPLTTIHDVWTNLAGTVEYHTGSITPNSLNSSEQNSVSQVVMNITNLRDTYHRNENARFRLYTRQKDWNPTIYTKAVSTPEIYIVESGSFKVVRLIDDLDVVAFGTGSDMHTQMSFDSSGSYFDVDMSMLEAGYGYGLKFAIYDGGAGAWNEYPDVFKFRVEE